MKYGSSSSTCGQLGELPHLRTIFTLGTNGLDAKEFFRMLKTVGVTRVVDIRRKPNSAFARFATKRDLPYFLQLHAISYTHLEDFAPSEDLLKWYKSRPDSERFDLHSQGWQEYTSRFLRELTTNKVLGSNKLEVQAVLRGEDMAIALLCTEEDARMCHRSLVARFLAYWYRNLEVSHLTTPDLASLLHLEQGDGFCAV